MGRCWVGTFSLLILTSTMVGAAQFGSGRGTRVASQFIPRDGAGERAPAVETPPDEAVRKAAVGGKYRTLLCSIRVAEDLQTYSAFDDYGFSNTPSWGGLSGLPPGYWVYVYPHWYIWKETATEKTAVPRAAMRPWGPEQATGEPDTDHAGDLPTAWASRTPDDQDEWLLLEYARPVVPIAVIVHETFNPGALTRITMFRPDSEEVDAWKGEDPTPAGKDQGVSIVPVRVDFETSKIKLFLDSRKVPGWNEIDAVGIVDQMGKTQWAVRAEASSTYADEATPPPPEATVLGGRPRNGPRR